jgi:hypothetical protein
LSVYLPNISTAYPRDTTLPIQIAYINYTDGSVNTYKSYPIHTGSGGPSAPQNVTQSIQNNVTSLIVERPVYSDSTAYFAEPFFSTYVVKYTLNQMNAVRGSMGFIYGTSTRLDIPPSLNDYTAGFTQSVLYTASTQTISLSGSQNKFITPGTVWGVSLSATNLASKPGAEVSLINISTAFPANNTPSISSIALLTTNTDVSYARNSTLKTLVYSNGWYTSVPVANDVLFLSSPTTLNIKLNTEVQWNDTSYPGDRSTMKVCSYFTNIDNNRININTLNINSVSNDFSLSTLITTILPFTQLTTTVLETQPDLISQKYFYKAMHWGSHTVSTISAVPQSIQFEFTNRVITEGLPVRNQIASSPAYLYMTEPANPYDCTGVVYNGACTSTIQISGLHTPSVHSQLSADIYGKNFINNFSYSNMAEGSLFLGDTPIGPMNYFTSNVYVYNGATPVTSLPFPQNTTLHISSVKFNIDPNVYQDPNDMRNINIRAYPISANPVHTQGTYQTGYSNIYIDTVSETTYSTFTNSHSPNGKRLVSLLPRPELSFTAININDTMTDYTGACGQGLNTSISSFVYVGNNNDIYISNSIEYNHKSSISTIYTDMYSRELLYTNGKFIHPAGQSFSTFTGALISQPNAIYPNFTYDLIHDVNKGYRYATFAFETPVSEPSSIQYLYVKMTNASNVSSIGLTRAYNFFPDGPVETDIVSFMKVRMHAKVIGAYNDGNYKKSETAWLNCFKERNGGNFSGVSYNDVTYDIGAAVSAEVFPNPPYYDVEYKIQLTSREYTKLSAVVRIGIARDGSTSSGDPLMFDSIQTRYSDI